MLRDMGNGPYYTLFRPFHLCSIEVPLTCAMMALRRRSNMVPLDQLTSEVFAVAKRDLQPGETLDGIGGTSYLWPDRYYETARAEGLLADWPGQRRNAGASGGVDTPITYADVDVKPSTVLDLRRLQDAWMAGTIGEGRCCLQSTAGD